VIYLIWRDAVMVMPGAPGGEVLAYLSPRQWSTTVAGVGVEVNGPGETAVWEVEEHACGT